MTEQTDAAEVREALRTILAEHDAKWHAQPNSLIAHEARASLLARLAAREAAARAEAWEQAHAAFCPRAVNGHDICSTHLRPGDRWMLARTDGAGS